MSCRVICLFVRENLYLVRPKFDDNSLWSFRTTTEVNKGIENELKKRFGDKCAIQGVALIRSCCLPSSNRTLVCIHLVVKVQHKVEEQLSGVGWKWMMFSTIASLVSSNEVPSDVLKAATAVETGKLLDFTEEIYEKSDMERIVGRQLDDCLDGTQTALKIQAGFGKAEGIFLFDTFLEYCWPSDVMRFVEFSSFFSQQQIKSCSDLNKLFWYPAHFILLRGMSCLKCLFSAFDINKNGFITFSQWLIGLAAMQPHTPHGKEAGDQRSRYIYRYYCHGSSNSRKMTKAQLKLLAEDVKTIQGLPHGPKTYDSILSHYSSDMDMNTFVRLVGNLKLRGTSTLFRLKENTIENIKKGNNISVIIKETANKSIQTTNLEEEVDDCSSRKKPKLEIDTLANEQSYQLAHHSVSVSSIGTVFDHLIDVTEGVSCSARIELERCPNSQIDDDAIDDKMAVQKANDILHGLTFFSRSYMINRGDDKEPVRKPAQSWDKVRLKGLALVFIDLCKYIKQLLHKEARCLELNSPVYVMGDLHGNYEDLMEFVRRLWPLGPKFCPAHLLFLGDYVDRNDYGFEVVAYILCQKILNPDRVFLLRGNHELLHIQRNFNFKRECVQKFGSHYGKEVWLKVNECFDELPLAATIDGKIFCVHGGLPHPNNLSTRLIQSINDIPCPLRDNADISPLAWDLMWNDPVFCDNPPSLDEHGFGPNEKRGEAKVFSSNALQKFLSDNGFSHVIRAHQVKNEGFHVGIMGKSAYCGLDNGAACVLVGHGKLRVLRFPLQQENKQNKDKL